MRPPVWTTPPVAVGFVHEYGDMPKRIRKLLIAVRNSVMCRALISTPPVISRFGSVKVGGSLGGADGGRSVGGESETGLPSSRADVDNLTVLFMARRSVGRSTFGSLG